jgi:NADPH:quinone reductase-like Zn-dependent oxidoreductase
MKAWEIEGAFGIDKLKQNEIAKSPMGPDEVRVRICACSLNFRDLMVVKGFYNPKQNLPLIPVSDGAGVVTQVGSLVKDFRVGDRVCGTFSQHWTHGRIDELAQKYTLGSPLAGMLQEERVFKESGLVKFPAHLSFKEAATLPCAALTAFSALVYEAEAKPGQSVLLEGSGGVSIFALQFAKILGLSTIVLTSKDEKVGHLKELGAGSVINYRSNPDWSGLVRKSSDDLGVDIVIEVGGKQTMPKAIEACRRGASICLIGILSGPSIELALVPILMQQLRILGIFVGSRNAFLAMNRVIEHSGLRPVIDRVFSFAKAKEAFLYMESAQHFGKIVIDLEQA